MEKGADLRGKEADKLKLIHVDDASVYHYIDHPLHKIINNHDMVLPTMSRLQTPSSDHQPTRGINAQPLAGVGCQQRAA